MIFFEYFQFSLCNVVIQGQFLLNITDSRVALGTVLILFPFMCVSKFQNKQLAVIKYKRQQCFQYKMLSIINSI